MIRIWVSLACAFLVAGCQIEGMGLGATDSGTANSRVSLYWNAPLERVNGESLNMEEIDGYQVRYRHKNDWAYTTVRIEDSGTDQYHVQLKDARDYVFQVAAIDSNGVYSRYVTASR